jgi:hypothetical protein
MKTRLLLITLMAILISCKKHVPRNNEITRVEVATGGCFGPCQYTALSIDSSLELKYYGGHLLPDRWRKTLQGYYDAKVSRGFWDTLNMKLEHIKYKKLDTARNWVIDSQDFEIIIHYDRGVKHIRFTGDSFPDSVETVFRWIDSSYRTVVLHHIKGPIQFETVVQGKHMQASK